MPVFLESFLGRFPPAFPFRFAKDVPDQPLCDLRQGGVAAGALKDIPHDGGRIFPGQFFDYGEVARFPREKMFRWNSGKIFRRILQLHRVRFLAHEIDDDLVEEQVPFRDAAKPPAFMQTKSSWLEFIELLSGSCS